MPAVSASAPGSLAGVGAQGWLQEEESRGSPGSPLAWRILLPGFALAAEHAECWAALLIQNQTETTLVSGLCPGVSSCCRFLSPVTRNEERTPFPLVQCDGSGFFRCSSTAQLPPALPTLPVDLAKPSARRAGAVSNQGGDPCTSLTSEPGQGIGSCSGFLLQAGQSVLCKSSESALKVFHRIPE